MKKAFAGFLFLLLFAATSFAATPEWKNVDSYTGTDPQRVAAAISALGSTGGVVYFPPRTYTFDTQVNLASNVILRGDGAASLISMNTGFTYAFHGSSISNAGIEGLSFTGSNTAIPMKFASSSKITVRDVSIHGAGGKAVWLSGVTDALIDHVTVTGSGLSETSSQAIALFAEDSSRVRFTGNTVVATYNTSPYLVLGIGAQNSSEVEMTGNFVTGTTASGSQGGYGLYLYETTSGSPHRNVVS